MITQEIKADTLEEYFQKLCTLQTDRHGKEYTDVHDEIQRLIGLGCDSYAEFGIMQGTTLAAALFAQPSYIQAVDIDLKWYNQAKHLFEEYAERNDIKLVIKEASSLEVEIDDVDLLYIDSVHIPKHLLGELNKHHKRAKKYILLHDTTHKPQLHVAASKWCQSNPWKVVKRYTVNVGYTTLQKETS
jgi:hypothetical protein